jgi:hypothetical protein
MIKSGGGSIPSCLAKRVVLSTMLFSDLLPFGIMGHLTASAHQRSVLSADDSLAAYSCRGNVTIASKKK